MTLRILIAVLTIIICVVMRFDTRFSVRVKYFIPSTVQGIIIVCLVYSYHDVNSKQSLTVCCDALYVVTDRDYRIKASIVVLHRWTN